MKKKVEYFINEHNKQSAYQMPYDSFDKKFLQHMSKEFDEVKFFLVYLIMNLINMNLPEEQSLTKNNFSNLRKIELMFNLSLIIDKTLSETYQTKYISNGVIQYLFDEVGISERSPEELLKNLTYADGSEFKINGDPKVVAEGLLNSKVMYKGKAIEYRFRSMLLAWSLRNFSAHNLTGIDQLLMTSYSSMLTMLFSALFFAAEIL